MVSFSAMLLDLENSIELFAKLFVFIRSDVQGEGLCALETRIFRAHADASGTSAFVLEQLLAFRR